MSTPIGPRREHPSTYMVQDRSNQEELLRLQVQDGMVTSGMGGVLPEQPDPTRFQRILDVGCGTGAWLIEAAKAYPSMSLLVGVDVSERMLDYARAQAEGQQVSERVQFRTMDALRMLEFPTGYFDVVNQRLGWSYLRTWDWPKLLQEFQRVARPTGVIRFTEFDIIQSTSPALTGLCELTLEAFYKAGHFFHLQKNGVTSELVHLLQKSGIQQVQTRTRPLEYRAGSVEGQYFAEDLRHLFRTLLPFFHKWTRVPDNYEAIYQQMLHDMQQPGFVATWDFVTAWGIRWGKAHRPLMPG